MCFEYEHLKTKKKDPWNLTIQKKAAEFSRTYATMEKQQTSYATVNICNYGKEQTHNFKAK